MTPAACALDDCDKPVHGRNGRRLCRMHLARVERHGDPRIVRNGRAAPGELSAKWRGNNVAYRSVHSRLVRKFGPASARPCVDCGRAARDWSYVGGSPDEMISPTGRAYTPDLDFYEPRCRGCHIAFDRRDTPGACKTAI